MSPAWRQGEKSATVGGRLNRAPGASPDVSIAILAHGKFPERAKTAVGLLRYGDREVAAVLDRATAGDRVTDHVSDVRDAPIVESMADAPGCETLVVGIAPIGGDFDESWRPDVRTALCRGCDVVAGLHSFLAEDAEFARLADEHSCEIRDVRRPPDDLTVASGGLDPDATVVCTVGTDCSTGKMTTTFELRRAARERGIDAAVVPTGQTGIMLAGRGIAIDRVVSDFAAGAVERLLEEADDHDVLVVEGQGALGHPAYSGVTLSILHGCQPDALVLTHVAGREAVHGYEAYPLPPPGAYAKLYERVCAPVAETSVAAGSLDTSHLGPTPAREAVDAYERRLGVPATDPVRFDAGKLLDAVL